MKKNNIILIFLFIGCTQLYNFDKEQRVLDEIIKTYGIPSTEKATAYLVTGLDGCGACLDYTVKFIEKNSAKSNMFFVLSGTSNVKIKALFTYSTAHSTHFIRDTLQIALRKTLVEHKNPKIFLCKSGNIFDVKDITYANADSVFNYVNKTLKMN